MFHSSSTQPLPSPEVREALLRLDTIGRQRSDLSEFIELYRELLPVLFGPGPVIELPAAANENKADRLSRGEPVLRGVSLSAVEATLSKRWRQVCLIVGRRGQVDSSRGLGELVERGGWSLGRMLAQVIESGTAEFREQLAQRGLDVSLGSAVLRLTVLPLLASWARSLESNWLVQGWPHGHCPVCGSWPLVAEFRGIEQFRWLRCGLCAAGWQTDRMFCPFCTTRDHRQLRELVVEGQEQQYRVSACDACGGFVRGLATLAPLSAPALLVAELETLHLELIAHSRGYSIAERENVGGD